MLPKTQEVSILELSTPREISHVLRDIQVDPYGIRIMLPKAESRLIRINGLSNIAANILKQEMLSLGGDVAVSRNALTGKTKKTDCLIIGDLSSITRLIEKLRRQPFGLNSLADKIRAALTYYRKENFSLKLGRYKLNLGKRVHIMGIVNITPDSFSGDGLLKNSIRDIASFAQKMASSGADIIDIGGESTRPKAKPVSLKEELRRIVPVVKLLAKTVMVPVSIDTYKPEVALAALDNGALMVNDISGLRDAAMAKVVSRYKAGVVIMHMKGNPRSMQKRAEYASVMNEVNGFLSNAIDRAVDCGIKREKIIIDPGIGFGKTLEHNLEVLKNLSELKVLGLPIMVGLSRKSFIGKILNKEPNDRITGTIASGLLAAKSGANILRVHDVWDMKEALKILKAVEYGWN